MIVAVCGVVMAYLGSLLLGVCTVFIVPRQGEKWVYLGYPVTMAVTQVGMFVSSDIAPEKSSDILHMTSILIWTGMSIMTAVILADLDGLRDTFVMSIFLTLAGFSVTTAIWEQTPSAAPQIAAALGGFTTISLGMIKLTSRRPLWRGDDIAGVVMSTIAVVYLAEAVNAVAESGDRFDSWAHASEFVFVWWISALRDLLKQPF